jgi:hypothetical protein
MSAWRPHKTGLERASKCTTQNHYVCWLLTCFFFPSFLYLNSLLIITEMKCIACPKTGCMLNLEIHWREDGKKTLKYNHWIGATYGCTFENDRRYCLRGYPFQWYYWRCLVKLGLRAYPKLNSMQLCSLKISLKKHCFIWLSSQWWKINCIRLQVQVCQLFACII